MAILITALPLLVVAALWTFLSPEKIDKMINDQALTLLVGSVKPSFSVTLWAASELLFVATLSYLVIGLCIFLLTHFRPLSAESVGMHD